MSIQRQNSKRKYFIIAMLTVVMISALFCVRLMISSNKNAKIANNGNNELQAAEEMVHLSREEMEASEDYADYNIITTPEEFLNMQLDKKYILMNDIDFSGKDYSIIGESNTSAFTGIFDGNNYTIRNVNIESSNQYVGLFGYINGGTVKNLKLENEVVKSTYTNTSNTQENGAYIGGLVGYIKGETTIANVEIIGNSSITNAEGDNAVYAGGFIGYIEISNSTRSMTGTGTSGKTANISNVSSTGAIMVKSANGVINVGGLIGYMSCAAGASDSAGSNYKSPSNSTTLTMSKAYSTEEVNAISQSGEINAGGLIGYVSNSARASISRSSSATSLGISAGATSYISISETYSTGMVTAESINGEINAGGLIGYENNSSSTNTSGSIIKDYSSVSSTASIGINNAYAIGEVIATSPNGQANIGGLIGYVYNSRNDNSSPNATKRTISSIGITNTYAIGEVKTPNETANAGGLIGYKNNDGTEGTSTTGTIVTSVENSYWSPKTTGQVESKAGEERSIQELLYKTGYDNNWDFEEVWTIDEGNCLAYLKELPKPKGILKEDLVFETRVTVKSVDENNKMLPAVKFVIKNEDGSEAQDKDGNLIGDLITNEKGIARILNLNPGTYILEQTEAPESYVMSDVKYKFKLNEKGKVVNVDTEEEINLVIQNDKIRKDLKGIKVEIVNEKSNEVKINGAKVKALLANANEEITYEGENFVTNDDGILELSDADIKQYGEMLLELEAVNLPAGYKDIQTKTIKYTNREYAGVTIDNEFTSDDITIEIDEETNIMHIILYAQKETIDMNVTVVDAKNNDLLLGNTTVTITNEYDVSGTTNVDEDLMLQPIKPVANFTTYNIQLSDIPLGYAERNEQMSVDVNFDEFGNITNATSSGVKVTAYNEGSIDLKIELERVADFDNVYISLYEKDNLSNPLKGAEYCIYARSKDGFNAVYNGVTSADGKIEAEYYGNEDIEIIIKQTKEASGYKLDKEEKVIALNREQGKVQVKNELCSGKMGINTIDNDMYVELTNEGKTRKNTINIQAVYDKDREMKLQNIPFTVSTEGYSQTGVTDIDGNLNLSDIPSKANKSCTYTVTLGNLPSVIYHKKVEEFKINVVFDKDGYINMLNLEEPSDSVRITKESKEDEQTLSYVINAQVDVGYRDSLLMNIVREETSGVTAKGITYDITLTADINGQSFTSNAQRETNELGNVSIEIPRAVDVNSLKIEIKDVKTAQKYIINKNKRTILLGSSSGNYGITSKPEDVTVDLSNQNLEEPSILIKEKVKLKSEMTTQINFNLDLSNSLDAKLGGIKYSIHEYKAYRNRYLEIGSYKATTDTEGKTTVPITINSTGRYIFAIVQENEIPGYTKAKNIVVNMRYEEVDGANKCQSFTITSGSENITTSETKEIETDDFYTYDTNLYVINKEKSTQLKPNTFDLRINKLSNVQSYRLQGVEYKAVITYGDGLQEERKIITNTAGEGIIRDIYIGLGMTIELTEIGIPSGYEKDDYTYTINVNGTQSGGLTTATLNLLSSNRGMTCEIVGEDVVVTHVNQKSPNEPNIKPDGVGILELNLCKENMDIPNLLIDGAVFNIKVIVGEDELLNEDITIMNGKYRVGTIAIPKDIQEKEGRIEITEIESPVNYKIDSETKVIYFNNVDGKIEYIKDDDSINLSSQEYSKTYKIVNVELKNKLDKFAIVINKVDKYYNYVGINECIFKIERADGKGIAQEIVIRRNGVEIAFPEGGVNETVRYIITETKEGSGYYKLANPILIEVTFDEDGDVSNAKILAENGYDSENAIIQEKEGKVIYLRIANEPKVYSGGVEIAPTPTITPTPGTPISPGIPTSPDSGITPSPDPGTPTTPVPVITPNPTPGSVITPIPDPEPIPNKEADCFVVKFITMDVAKDVAIEGIYKLDLTATNGVNKNMLGGIKSIIEYNSYENITLEFEQILVDNRYAVNGGKKSLVINRTYDNKLSFVEKNGDFEYDINDTTKVVTITNYNKMSILDLQIETEARYKGLKFEVTSQANDNKTVITNKFGMASARLNDPQITKVQYNIKSVDMPADCEEIPNIIVEVDYNDNGTITDMKVIEGQDVAEIIGNPTGRRTIPIKIHIADNLQDDNIYTIKYVVEDEDNSKIKLTNTEFKVDIEKEFGTPKQYNIKSDINGIAKDTYAVSFGRTTYNIRQIATKQGYMINEGLKTIVINKTEDNKARVESYSGDLAVVVSEIDKEITVTIKNKKNKMKFAELIIEKVDSKDSFIRIPNTKFYVGGENVSDSLKTNNEGVCRTLIPILKENTSRTYTIQETSVPRGFVLNSTAIRLVVEYDEAGIKSATIGNDTNRATVISAEQESIRVRIANDRTQYIPPDENLGNYDIEVVKVDKNNINLTKEGATLKVDVKNEIGTEFITKTDVTNSKGIISINDINGFGEILINITELEAPENMKLDTNEKWLKLYRNEEIGNIIHTESSNVYYDIDNSTRKITVYIRDEIDDGLYSIVMNKVGTDGEGLAGAEFELTMPDGTKIERIASIIGGYAGITNLKMPDNPGTYSYKLREAKNPNGYRPCEDEIDLNVTFEMKNGKMCITKVEVLNSEKCKLINTEYINLSNGKISKNKTENTTGVIDTKNCFELDVINEPINPKLELTIKKVDNKNNNPLANANFKIIPEKNLDIQGEVTLPTTNAKGETSEILTIPAVIGDYNYNIVETDTPFGYEDKSEGMPLTMHVDKAQDGSYVVDSVNWNDESYKVTDGKVMITVENKEIMPFIIDFNIHDNTDSKATIKDAIYEINVKNITTGQTKVLSNLSSDEFGKIVTEEIYGVGDVEIRIKQQSIALQYEEDTEEKLIKIRRNVTTGDISVLECNGNNIAIEGVDNNNGEHKILKLNATCKYVEPEFNLKIDSVDFGTNKPLKDVKFKITAKNQNGDNIKIKTPSGSKDYVEVASDENGNIILNNIVVPKPEGEYIYTIEETEKPDGYRTNYDKVKVKITSGTMQNGYYGVIKAEKLDEEIAKKQTEIVLSMGDTEYDASKFDEDLYNKLRAYNVDVDNVKINMYRSQNVDAYDDNFEEILRKWKQLGDKSYSYPVQVGEEVVWKTDNEIWKTQAENIICKYNTYNFTGFYNPNVNAKRIKMNYNATASGWDDDVIGAIIKLNENADGTVTTYLFMQSSEEHRDPNWGCTYGLYKIENDTFSSSSIKLLQACSVGWKPEEFSGYEIEAVNDTIKVKMNGKVIINYTDMNNPILTGSYGFFSWSQQNATFNGLVAEATNFDYMTYEEVLNEYDWDNDSVRCIVNVSDNEESILNTSASLAIAKNINYIGLGTDNNKRQNLQYVQDNNNNGTYIENQNYKNSIDNIAKYIKRLIDETIIREYPNINVSLSPETGKINETVNIKLANEQLDSYNLKITAVDKENTNTKLSGIEYKVTVTDLATNTLIKEIEKTERTNNYGQVSIDGIPGYGKYKIEIQRLTTPRGYKTNEENNKTIFITRNSKSRTINIAPESYDNTILIDQLTPEVNVFMENEPANPCFKLEMENVDYKNNANKLTGAKLEIELPNGATTENGERKIIVICDNTSTVQEIPLPKQVGNYQYKITELQAPAGYNGISSPVTLTVTVGKNGNAYVANGITASNSERMAMYTNNVLKIFNKAIDTDFAINLTLENLNYSSKSEFKVDIKAETGEVISRNIKEKRKSEIKGLIGKGKITVDLYEENGTAIGLIGQVTCYRNPNGIISDIQVSNSSQYVIEAKESEDNKNIDITITKNTTVLKSSKYSISEDEKIIYGISPETTVSDFISNISTNEEYTVIDASGNSTNSTVPQSGGLKSEKPKEIYIGTGSKIKLGNTEYTLIVTGDIDGNGILTITDATKINLHLVNIAPLEGIYKIAADTSFKGDVSITDAVKARLALVNLITFD